MPAKHGNTNASKAEKGNGALQVNASFYLKIEEVAAIKRLLQRQDLDTSDKAIRKYVREKMMNGLWLAIRDELSGIIL